MPVPEILKMYQLRPTINLRQIAIAAAIAIIASFAIYYVFDVMPRDLEDKKFVSDEVSDLLEFDRPSSHSRIVA